MEKDGKKVVRESTTRGMRTFDTPLEKWLQNINKEYNDLYLGLSIMRVRDELNTPGRIIKPWEISRLKSHPTRRDR